MEIALLFLMVLLITLAIIATLDHLMSSMPCRLSTVFFWWMITIPLAIWFSVSACEPYSNSEYLTCSVQEVKCENGVGGKQFIAWQDTVTGQCNVTDLGEHFQKMTFTKGDKLTVVTHRADWYKGIRWSTVAHVIPGEVKQ